MRWNRKRFGSGWDRGRDDCIRTASLPLFLRQGGGGGGRRPPGPGGLRGGRPDPVLPCRSTARLFVTEVVASLPQLVWKRFFKRKLYSVGSFPHWLEKIGWPEYQVTMRLWILGAAFAAVGLILALIGAGKMPLKYG